MKKKSDIIIVQMRDGYEGNSRYSSIREEDVATLFELKFISETAQSTADWMKDDLKKLKAYVQKSRFQCSLYFAVIYEVGGCWPHWLDKRSTNNWTSGGGTELDAGWIDRIHYEIYSY